MIRALWLTFVGALCFVALGAQLDRASRRQSSLAPFVPAIFRNFAQETVSLAQVRSAEPDQALQDARLLLSRSPLPAEHLTLLAIAEERKGNREISSRLIQQAAQRGWRDAIAQQAMFDIALSAGDPVEASHRFAAIWALRDNEAPLLDMRNRLLAARGGKEALAGTLAAGGSWTRYYLRSVTADLDPLAVESTILAIQKGASLECAILGQMRTALAKRNRDREATALGSCKRAPA